MSEGIRELVYAAAHAVGPGWATPLSHHSHPYIEMLVMVSGDLEIDAAGERLRVTTNDVVYYPPGGLHRERTPPDCRCEFVVLAFQEPLPGEIPLVTHDTSGRLSILARWMNEETGISYVRTQEGMNRLLQSFLYTFVKLLEFQPEDPLMRERTFLREHAAEKHTLDDLARMAGMSKFHFVRQYKRVTGFTPMEDLLRMRIEKAAGWLLISTMPIKTIALQAGFCDVSYFTRAFRRARKISPAAFRAGGGGRR